IGHALPVERRAGCERLAHRGQAGAMREDVARANGLLGGDAELGPEAGHGLLDIEEPAGGRAQGGERGGGPTYGGEIDERIRTPFGSVFAPGKAAPQIDNLAIVHEDDERRADLAVHLKVSRERVAHALKARIAATVNRRHLASIDARRPQVKRAVPSE